MIETRMICQVRIWKLIMNPMTSHAEACEIAAWSDDKDNLIQWYRNQLTEPYGEEGMPTFDSHGNSHTWHKQFSKGSPLEWFNPIYILDEPDHYGHGLVDEWINEDVLPRINTPNRI